MANNAPVSRIPNLSKRLQRLINLDLPATETLPELKGTFVLALDPEKGVTIRRKGSPAALHVSIETIVEVASGDTRRKTPNNRRFLLGQ